MADGNPSSSDSTPTSCLSAPARLQDDHGLVRLDLERIGRNFEGVGLDLRLLLPAPYVFALEPGRAGGDSSLFPSGAVPGALKPWVVGLDFELVGPDPGGVGFDLLVFASDAFVFASDLVGVRLKTCGVGSGNVDARPKDFGVEPTVLDAQSATLGIPSKVVGILSKGFGFLSKGFGFLSTEAEFQSASRARRFTVADIRETPRVSVDFARGRPSAIAGFVEAPVVASNRDTQ